MATPKLPSCAETYLQAEHTQRRQEIENLVARIEQDQRYGLLVTGAIWSFVVTHRTELEPPFDLLVIFLPGTIMLFFYFRCRSIDNLILRVAAYTRHLESLFELPDGLGWESWLHIHRQQNASRDSLSKATFLFWILLTMGNFALAIAFLWLTRCPCMQAKPTIPLSRFL